MMFAPLAKSFTPLQTKANALPYPSSAVSNASVRSPTRCTFSSAFAPPQYSAVRRVYSGCAPYPFGHQSCG